MIERRLESLSAESEPALGDHDAAQLDDVVGAAQAGEKHEANRLAGEFDRQMRLLRRRYRQTVAIGRPDRDPDGLRPSGHHHA